MTNKTHSHVSYFNIMDEKASLNSIPQFCPFFLLFDFLFYSIPNLFLRFWSLFQSTLDSADHSKVRPEKKNQNYEPSSELGEKKDVGKGSLSREDVEMVMGNLGIFCGCAEGGELQEWLDSNDLSGLFDEQEPSLEEVREAFDVFDENRDGFIDVHELRRVLCILGSMEGLKLEDCKKMIRRFDGNGDGRIDFNEFVKLMHDSVC